MSQQVEISDGLALDAHEVAEAAERTIAGQIEHWAQIGRLVEPLLDSAHATALRRAGAVQSLAQLLSSVDSAEGRKRVADYLATLPFPHYEAANEPGLLVRIDADGSRTIGRIVNRQFLPAAQ